MEVEKSVWKKGVRENTSVKDLGPCYRIERKVHTKKRKGVLVEREKGGSIGICRGSVEERIYSTFQVTPNITSILCGKKGWHTKNGTRLLIHKPVDNKEWVSLIPHRRYTGWSRKEKGVHKARSEMRIQ